MCQVISYRLPARVHDLIVDRKDAAASEAFLVVLKPGEAVGIHRGAGQVLSILDGDGELTVDETDQETFLPRVGDFVRTPPGVHHAVKSLRDVEAESQPCAGHRPFAVTSRLNTICVRAWPGETVPAHVHHDEDEVYRAAPGEGVVEFGARERRISGGSDVAMSLCTEHAITNTGPESLDCVSFVVLVAEPA